MRKISAITITIIIGLIQWVGPHSRLAAQEPREVQPQREDLERNSENLAKSKAEDVQLDQAQKSAQPLVAATWGA